LDLNVLNEVKEDVL